MEKLHSLQILALGEFSKVHLAHCHDLLAAEGALLEIHGSGIGGWEPSHTWQTAADTGFSNVQSEQVQILSPILTV